MKRMPGTVLITGAAGFAMSHMVEHFLKNTKDNIIGVDCLNYSGTWDRLRDSMVGEYNAFEHPRFTPLAWDFRRPSEPNLVRELQNVTHIIHGGALSHVDHSIKDPLSFVEGNVIGTCNVLNLARELKKLKIFSYFGTDESLGDVGVNPNTGRAKQALKEDAPYNSRNPYSATKSGAEQLVVAFANTYKLPCIITRTMNIMGERQHPEKFIPLCINAALNGNKVYIHSTPDKKWAGVRAYIHARNVADAYVWLFKKQPWRNKPVSEVDKYHIVGELEVDNKSLALAINRLVKKHGDKVPGLSYEMVDFHSSRAGHDVAYMLDGSKLEGLGWKPPKTFYQALDKTVQWYLNPENKRWLR